VKWGSSGGVTDLLGLGMTQSSGAAKESVHLIRKCFVCPEVCCLCCPQAGWTPLIMASVFGHLDVVRELLSKGADVESKNVVS
jgi:hypothetical protein